MSRQGIIIWTGFALVAIGLIALFGWAACLIVFGLVVIILAAAGYFN